MFCVSIAPDVCLHLSPCAIVIGLDYKILEDMGNTYLIRLCVLRVPSPGAGIQKDSKNVSFKCVNIRS